MVEKTSSFSRFLVVAAAFVIVVSGLKMAGPLLVPFLLAVFIAMIVSPLLAWLKRYHLPNGVAIFVVIALVFSVGLILAAVIGSSVDNFRQDIPTYSAKLTAMSTSIQQWLSQRGIAIDSEQWSSSFNPGAVMGVVGNTLASFGNVMTNAVMILLTVIFILAENVSFGEKLRSATGSNNSQEWLRTFSDLSLIHI